MSYVWRYNPVKSGKHLESAGNTQLVAAVLGTRGYDVPQAYDFLYGMPCWQSVMIPEMKHAAEIVLNALRNSENILVVGDYDADGICGAAILKLYLEERSGKKVHAFIPARSDGYGFKLRALEEAERVGASLIITVDCGTNDKDTCQAAQDKGMRVVVTDHHESLFGRPPADAVVNLKLNTGFYPFKELCGAAVAYKLVEAVCDLEQRPCRNMEYFLTLTTVATIADMVLLVNENRAIVKRGLKITPSDEYPGLKELYSVSQLLEPTSRDIAFKIAPRINAAGRLSNPAVALDLLITRDPEKARSIAQKLDKLNKQRQEITNEAYAEIVKELQEKELPNIIVARTDIANEGIAGPLANRLINRFGVPVLIVSNSGAGSGRAPDGYDLLSILSRVKDEFKTYGGHRQACGFNIDLDRLDRLRKRLTGIVPICGPAYLDVDAIVKPQMCTLSNIEALEELEPYGMGNPKPLFLFRDIAPVRVKAVGKNNDHYSFNINNLRCIWFNGNGELLNKTSLDFGANLNVNVFRETKSPQAMIVAASESLRFNKSLLTETYVYLCNNKKYRQVPEVAAAIFEELDLIERTPSGFVVLPVKEKKELYKSTTYRLYAS